jgi:hypothetical protein
MCVCMCVYVCVNVYMEDSISSVKSLLAFASDVPIFQ